MRLLFASRLLTLALLLVVPGGAGTWAEPMPKAVIAVLDYARILQESDAAKDIRRQAGQYGDRFRNDIQTEEKRLREMEAELKRQRGVSSLAAFEESSQKFKRQVMAAQRQGQDFKRKLDEALKMAEVQQAVIPIVRKLTVEKGYTIVVDNSQVLFADRAHDITKEVMDRLNQTLRTVAVAKPQ